MTWLFSGVRVASPKDTFLGKDMKPEEVQCQVPGCSAPVARIATWARGQPPTATEYENRRLCLEHAGDEAGRDAVAPKEPV